MSSYHSSFTYLNKNSSQEGFIIASFEPDSGFVDTYLDMEQIVSDSYDGVKKHFYGSKYNKSAEILITLIKKDGSDFSMEDNRKALRWLTGNRQASWLDFYVGDNLVYSFYGNITTCQQQKLDARIIGLQVTFASIYPWAWSAPQSFNCRTGEKKIAVENSGSIYKTYEDRTYFGITEDGVIYNSSDNASFTFNIRGDGVVYNDTSISLAIDNQSDDLYSLTNLDMVYINTDSTSLIVKNLSLGEETTITGIDPGEVVSLSAGQFIISETFPTKIFGETFNFIWPKLRPGINHLYIDGSAKGLVQFAYRYPIKIGDCAIDVENIGRDPICEGDLSDVLSSVDGVIKLGRKNVMLVDETTNTPYTVSVKDSYLHVVKSNDDRNHSIVLKENATGALYKMTIDNASLCLVGATKSDDAAARDSIVLIDESSNKPYELTVKGNNLYLSEIQTYGGE